MDSVDSRFVHVHVYGIILLLIDFVDSTGRTHGNTHVMNVLNRVLLGDNCTQIFHLGRYIVGYMVGNFVLRPRFSGAVKHDFDRIYDDIPPQMKNLNMVIPILMYFLTFTHRKHFILCKTLASSAT